MQVEFFKTSDAQDFAQFSRYPGLDGLETMSARWVKHSFRLHAHDFYAVSLNYRGGGTFHCRGELRETAPGTSNLIASGQLHTGQATCDLGWIYRNLYVETTLLSTLLRALDCRASVPLGFRAPVTRDENLAERLTKVFASLQTSSFLLQNESLLLAVVARLITHHLVPAHTLGDRGREHAAVKRVRE